MKKSATPGKKKETPAKAAKAVLSTDALSSKMEDISITTANFNMDFMFPYLVTVYNEGNDIMAKIEVLTPLYPRDYFIPDIVSGKRVEIRTKVPSFFYNERRLKKAYSGTEGFNENTHEAQAFKSVCDSVDTYYGFSDHIYGENAMVVKLPFVCEERIVSWECQAHRNRHPDLEKQLNHKQFHNILTIKCMKLKTKRRMKGAFRVVVDGSDDDSSGGITINMGE